VQSYQDKIQEMEINHAEEMKQSLERHANKIQEEHETEPHLKTLKCSQLMIPNLPIA
jgi:hypothetical protein